MSKKKEPDKLALDMIQCRKDGYGCHYGHWKAAQGRTEPIEKPPQEIPQSWILCKHCGKPFKPKPNQLYHDTHCQYLAKLERKMRRYKDG